MIFYLGASNVLPLQSSIRHNVKILVVSDNISFNDSIKSAKPTIAISQKIGFAQNLNLIKGTSKLVSVSNYIAFNNIVGGGSIKRRLLNNNISFNNLISVLVVNSHKTSIEKDISQSLTFSQLLKRSVNPIVIESISLRDAIKINIVSNQIITDQTNFVGNAACYKFNCDFHAIAIRSSSKLKYITLAYGPLNFTLKSPKFGDIFDYEPTRVIRRTRGGDIEVLQDQIWPTTELLTYSFDTLTADDVINIKSLKQLSLGNEVLLIDWEGKEWMSIIVNPEEPIVQNSNQGDCGSWSTNIKLHSRLVSL